MGDAQMDFLYFGDREAECRLAACVSDLGELRRLVSAGDQKFRLETDKGVFEGDSLTTEPATTCAGLVSIVARFLCPVRRVLYFNPVVTASLFKSGFGFGCSARDAWPISESEIPILSEEEAWQILTHNFRGTGWNCERTAQQVTWIDRRGCVLLPRDPFDLNAEYDKNKDNAVPDLDAMLCRLLTSTNDEGTESLLPIFMRARDENRMSVRKFVDADTLKKLTIDDGSQLIKVNCIHETDDEISLLTTGTIAQCSKVEDLHVCLEGCGLNQIEDGAFERAPNLVTVTLEGDYLTIGSEAFANSPKLQSADVLCDNDSVSIGGGMFKGCAKLQSVYWGLGAIPADTFRDCKSLSSVKVYFPRENSGGPLKIGKDAFRGCESLERLTFDGDVEFEGRPFLECKKLREIRFGGRVTSHINRVLGGCTALERVEFSADSETLPSNMFVCCESLRDVVLPRGLRTLDIAGFRNCKKLLHIEIPASVENVEGPSWGFVSGYRCPAIDRRPIVTEDHRKLLVGRCMSDNVGIDWDVEVISPRAFEKNPRLKKINLSAVRSVEDEAFAGCLNLRHVVFPRYMEEIGPRAFMGCEGLTSLSLPCDLRFVGDCAFAQCGRLKKVTIKSCPCIAPTAFEGCFSLRELRVPREFDLGNLHLPPDVNVIRV